MKEITFKKVLDDEGNFKYLELLQGNQTITLSLGNTFASGNHSYVWDVLKETVDKIAETVGRENI